MDFLAYFVAVAFQDINLTEKEVKYCYIRVESCYRAVRLHIIHSYVIHTIIHDKKYNEYTFPFIEMF